MAKKIKIPKNYIIVEKKPVYLKYRQNKETGHLEGRKVVKTLAQSDKLHLRRVRKGKYAGEIVGLAKVPVRGSRNKRGTNRVIRDMAKL